MSHRSHSAGRDGRKSLSYDAPPFYMTPPPPPTTLSVASSHDSAGSDAGNVASSADVTATPAGADVAQRRQLGERLYPKVQSIQPVSFVFYAAYLDFSDSLTALLYVLYTAEVCHVVERHSLCFHLYADDTQIYTLSLIHI